jgi:hypothetical protein
MGRFVIAAYRPRPGKEAQLLEAVRDHHPILHGLGLVTERPPYVLRAQNGTLLEVFEWKSAEAIEQAHANPAVHALWARFAEVCDYQPLSGLEECNQLFAMFDAVAV